MKYDIVIAGGGASGLTAAIEAKKICPELNIAIAERLDRVGKKILATGNGRCNLTHEPLEDHKYHGSVRNFSDIIASFPAKDFFTELGVVCITDSQGRVYPSSGSAAAVLGALRLRLIELGIDEHCGFCLNDIAHSRDGFVLHSTDGRQLGCRKVIIAAGGYASPQFGTDGTVMRIFRDKGYRISKICPAVAPLRVSPESVKGLKGVRVKGKVCAVSEGKVLQEEYGEIQFTDNSLSGICVFNLAHLYQKYEGRLTLRADLTDMSEKQLRDYLRRIIKTRASHQLVELLTGLFVKNLAVYLVKTTLRRPMTDSISTVTDAETERLVKRIKCLEFDVTGASPWKNTQVTMGGIHGSCVDSDLASVSDGDIYFCGEILDVTGDCGGYNLQWAWASGAAAGKACALSFGREQK